MFKFELFSGKQITINKRNLINLKVELCCKMSLAEETCLQESADTIETENAKDFYENFKNQLTDLDFSDCEMIETIEVDLSDQDEAADNNDYNSMLNDPLELTENVCVRIEKLDYRKLERIQNVKKVFQPLAKRCLEQSPPHQAKRPKLAELQCQRCGQTFKQQSFLDKHSTTQCDRHLRFLERRNKLSC